MMCSGLALMMLVCTLMAHCSLLAFQNSNYWSIRNQHSKVLVNFLSNLKVITLQICERKYSF